MLTLDYENSCRICLSSAKLESIFEVVTLQDEKKISEIVMEISGIEIDAGDNLSKLICEECKLKALELNSFRQ